MHIIFNGFAVIGLILNMMGTFFIIKYYIGFKEPVKQRASVRESLCEQKELKRGKDGFKILFAGFLFQFISTLGHSIYHVMN